MIDMLKAQFENGDNYYFFETKAEMYNQSYTICFDKKVAQQIVEEKFGYDENVQDLEDLSGFVYYNRGFLLVYTDVRSDINTIAHESFHLACRINNIHGVTFYEGDANEPFAYLIGDIAERISIAQKRYKKQIKEDKKQQRG